MSKTNLKPCPFCGKIPVIYHPAMAGGGLGSKSVTVLKFLYGVKCKCGASKDGPYDSPREAREAWNNRTPFN